MNEFNHHGNHSPTGGVLAPARGPSGESPKGSLLYTRELLPRPSNKALRSIDPPTNLQKTAEITERARARRYELREVVNQILPKGERARKCMAMKMPKAANIEMKYSEANCKASYHGLLVCGSIWACPVCAAKISERRSHEVQKAIDWWKSQGGQVFLMGLTVPHTRNDDLAERKKAQEKAYRRMVSGRKAQAMKQATGIKHTIRASEVTYGHETGWHPHFHVLLFVDGLTNSEQLHKVVSPLWQQACKAVDLPEPSFEHGCYIDGGEKASQYVSKAAWGMSQEMTKNPVKRAKKGRFSPVQLLEWAQEGEAWAVEKWREYFSVFKGTRHLVWSKGLKALAAVDDVSDSDLVVQELAEEKLRLVTTIHKREWKAIRHYRAQAALLTLAETCFDFPDDVKNAIKRLYRRYLNDERTRHC